MVICGGYMFEYNVSKDMKKRKNRKRKEKKRKGEFQHIF